MAREERIDFAMPYCRPDGMKSKYDLSRLAPLILIVVYCSAFMMFESVEALPEPSDPTCNLASLTGQNTLEIELYKDEDLSRSRRVQKIPRNLTLDTLVSGPFSIESVEVQGQAISVSVKKAGQIDTLKLSTNDLFERSGLANLFYSHVGKNAIVDHLWLRGSSNGTLFLSGATFWSSSQDFNANTNQELKLAVKFSNRKGRLVAITTTQRVQTATRGGFEFGLYTNAVITKGGRSYLVHLSDVYDYRDLIRTVASQLGQNIVFDTDQDGYLTSLRRDIARR